MLLEFILIENWTSSLRLISLCIKSRVFILIVNHAKLCVQVNHETGELGSGSKTVSKSLEFVFIMNIM